MQITMKSLCRSSGTLWVMPGDFSLETFYNSSLGEFSDFLHPLGGQGLQWTPLGRLWLAAWRIWKAPWLAFGWIAYILLWPLGQACKGLRKLPPRSVFAFLRNGGNQLFLLSQPLGCIRTSSHNPGF